MSNAFPPEPDGPADFGTSPLADEDLFKLLMALFSNNMKARKLIEAAHIKASMGDYQ